MTAPLHERLAKAAEQCPWITEPRGGPFIYSDHCDETGNGIQCPAIGVHHDHHPWQATKDFLLAAQPANVAKLCEQVRVLLGAVQAVEDFISGKPDAPEPFGITRDALKLVKESE